MSASSIKNLRIAHLRGSVIPFTLPFEKGKKLTIVYGENATGKTTICDAFEFLAKGKVGSLENRGLGKTARYWQSLGKSASDIAVTLETNDSTCTASIRSGEVVAAPPEHRPIVEVLRRSQILSLVEAQPGARYAEISRFIDVSGVEASESTLKDLIRSLETSRETAVARVQENEESIRNFWQSAGAPGKNAIAWAEGESTRDISVLQEELKVLGKLRTSLQRLSDHPEKHRAADAALSGARTIAEKAAKVLDTLLARAANDASELIDILGAATDYLAKHPTPAHCPLCESADKVANLRKRVEERVKQFDALQKAKRDKTTADKAVKTAELKVTDLRTELTRDAAGFEVVRAAHEWGDAIQLPKMTCPSDIAALTTWLKTESNLQAVWAKAESAREQHNQFISALVRALKTYKTNLQAQKDLDWLLPRLRRALEIVGEERRKFTDGKLRTIADDVGRLYEAVHPGEGLNKISLELDPNKRASLEIGASFAGQTGTPPQAYFSQSHLDTLGLCVFLSLARLDDPAHTILVLDDVLASVDEPHVERLIEMLYAEVMKFRHCVITTHYRPWKEKLRWGWLKNGQCHFVELTKWTMANGLTLTHSVPDVERLRTLLAEASPDLQSICSKAGVILEAALDFLTLLYECQVPRRTHGRHTLGDLLPAVDKKLRQALKVDVLTGKDASGAPVYSTTSLTPILDELSRIAQTRNIIGAHFNEISFELLEGDAIGFGKQVLALMDLLTDAEAGWPRSAKSGSYWATSGETRRLHPLQKPH